MIRGDDCRNRLDHSVSLDTRANSKQTTMQIPQYAPGAWLSHTEASFPKAIDPLRRIPSGQLWSFMVYRQQSKLLA